MLRINVSESFQCVWFWERKTIHDSGHAFLDEETNLPGKVSLLFIQHLKEPEKQNDANKQLTVFGETHSNNHSWGGIALKNIIGKLISGSTLRQQLCILSDSNLDSWSINIYIIHYYYLCLQNLPFERGKGSETGQVWGKLLVQCPRPLLAFWYWLRVHETQVLYLLDA